MPKVSEMGTPQLMAYSEIFTRMSQEIAQLDQICVQSMAWGGLTKEEYAEISADLIKHLGPIEDSRVSCVKELNRRVRHNFKVIKGPQGHDIWTDKIIKDHPVLKCGTKEEVETYMKEKEKNNLSPVKED